MYCDIYKKKKKSTNRRFKKKKEYLLQLQCCLVLQLLFKTKKKKKKEKKEDKVANQNGTIDEQGKTLYEQCKNTVEKRPQIDDWVKKKKKTMNSTY